MDNLNHQLAHRWAAYNRGTSTKDGARSSNGNFSFTGDALYSYSTVIARWLKTPDGTPWVLVDATRYSATTQGKHKNAMRRAIPSDVRQISVAQFPFARLEWPGAHAFDKKAASVVEQLATAAIAAQESAKRARTYKDFHLERAAELIQDAQFVAEAYGVPFDDPASLLAKIQREREAAAMFGNIGRFLADYDHVPNRLWFNLASALVNVAQGIDWLAGGEQHYGDKPTLLRVLGDMVETSQGAEFPLEHGLKALSSARLLNGERDFNGEGPRLGHFRIDRIEADGTIVAGCHRVPRFAVRWAARQAGQIEAPELDHVQACLGLAS